MDDIQQELEFLAVQAGSHKDQHAQIQKLSPAQMAALASGLGRRHGIKIEFGDFDTAATDGSTIALPLMNKENSWIVRGFLDHEVSHIRLTDFGLVPSQSAFKRSIWNVIEDLYIEARMPLLYPGMASNFRTLIHELRNTNPDFFKVPPDSPPDVIIACYISLLLRAIYLKQPVADLAIEARNVFIDTFGQQLEADLYRVISKIDNVDNSQEVLDLVDEIIELLKQNINETPEPPDDVDAGTGTGTTQNGDGQPQGTDTAGTEEQSQGPDQAPDREPNQAQHTKSTEPSQSDAPGTPGDNAEQQPGDCNNMQPAPDNAQPSPDHSNAQRKTVAIKDALESQVELGDFGEQLKDLAWAKEMHTDTNTYEIARPANNADLVATGYTPYPVQASSALVARLSSRLKGLLQAQDLQHGKPGMAGNRIARNRLHRIKTGEPRVFLKKHHQAQVNTAMQLLIDNSSSMAENDRFYKTRDVVTALVKALGTLRGVNLGMTVFPAFYPYNRHNGRHSIPVATILEHGRQNGASILYPQGPKGQTPLAPAVRYTASQMLYLQEPRRILLILTDGEPDSETDAEIAIKEAGALGIQVVCLGIEALMYPDIFPRFEIVKTVNDLPEATFRLLEQLLVASAS